MGGDAVANKLAMAPFSNNTIKRRIQEISADILQQTEKFSLQLDETTDIGSDAQLMAFLRYRTSENYVEQFLICHQLIKNTTAEETFENVNSFKEHQLSWRDCISVCADGAPSVMGKNRLHEFREERKTRRFSYSLSSTPRKSGSKRDSTRPSHSV